MYKSENDKAALGPNRTLARVGIPRAGAEDCIKAVAAPLRRRILRELHDVNEARSPIEIARDFGFPVGTVSYHIKILKERGTIALTDTRPVRGAVEHFYASTVIGNQLVVKVLEATRAGDEEALSA